MLIYGIDMGITVFQCLKANESNLEKKEQKTK